MTSIFFDLVLVPEAEAGDVERAAGGSIVLFKVFLLLPAPVALWCVTPLMLSSFAELSVKVLRFLLLLLL